MREKPDYIDLRGAAIEQHVKDVCSRVEGAHYRRSFSSVPLVEFARRLSNGEVVKFSASFFARKKPFWIVFENYMKQPFTRQRKFKFDSAKEMVKRLNTMKHGGEIVQWKEEWSPKR